MSACQSVCISCQLIVWLRNDDIALNLSIENKKYPTELTSKRECFPILNVIEVDF